MKELKFRLLKATEIDCRVATVTEKGFSILLYKDARCDMNILDETVGAYNWKREHTRDNANCVVSIWDDTKKEWISKEDTGTESFTEKEKGLASDSFKRACFNWGIGRELYTAPFIWINAKDREVFKKGDKYSTHAKMTVKEVKYNEDGKTIKSVVIVDKNGLQRFPSNNKPTPTPVQKSTQKNTKTLKEVIEEIQIVTAVKQLTAIWDKYPEFQGNKDFVNNLTFKKEELKTTK